MSRIGWMVTMAAGLLTVSPSIASAQAADFGNQKVWVTTVGGREQQGRLTSFTSSGVQLRLPDGSVTTLPMSDVQRVEVRDGLGNGARNGAIAGALFMVPLLAEIASECHGDCYATGPFLVSATLAYVAMGAGIGVGVDALRHGRKTIYSASAAPAPVAIAPIVTKGGAGVRVGIRW
jgi:hypothetical protein